VVSPLPMAAGEQRAERAARLPYIPGLDGLRAVAVIAVLLYHAGFSVWGGFLGVEAFFVLSGFLITALLLAEWREFGAISLRRFWFRRARRLLPALFLLLAGVVLYTNIWLPRESADVYKDTFAALAYVMNWHLIFGGQSYFDPLLRPPLLQHLWSLAVEEQFYLVWPIVFVVTMRVARKIGLLALTIGAALGSIALMTVLFQPGADPSRIYYGTDTRAAGLLLGSALAMVWTPGKGMDATDVHHSWLLDILGAVALIGLIACFFGFSPWHQFLYPGGFGLVALLTLILIWVVTHPGARWMPSILGSRPLCWIGVRSYGLYLWHWPVFMVTRPYMDVSLDGVPLFALRMTVVMVLVELSYRFVELPIRQGALERTWPGIREGLARRVTSPVAQRFPHLLSSRWLSIIIPALVLTLGSGLVIMRGSSAVASDSPARTSESDGDGLPPTPLPEANPTRVLVASIPPTPEAAGDVSDTSRPGANAAEPGEIPVTPTATIAPARTSNLEALEPSIVPITATATPNVPKPFDPVLAAELERLLDRTVANGFVPGAVLSVSVPGYEPWSGASGIADGRRQLRMEPGTLIHSASLTKMFTAVVVLQLAREGALDLDASIGTWLPGIIPFEQSTTVRHLLSHTSGIHDYLEDSRFFIQAYRNPDRIWTPAEVAATTGSMGPAFRPGTPGAWRYSSTNYVILGMLVEEVTGRPLAAEIRARIVEPLNLTNTYFAPDEPFSGAKARGYIRASDRADVSMTFVYATGNIVSTVGDLRRFTEALFTDQRFQAEKAAMTAFMNTGGAYDMPELEYGLGLMAARMNVGPDPTGTTRSYEAGRVMGHIGGIAGFRSAVWWAPESGITIALSLNQADIDPNLLARDTLDAVLTWQGR
jgi:peptidoglycan/LPS O-acetylase OafA/YrhL/CubicO group peptidase (beta-lactamase class C family)